MRVWEISICWIGYKEAFWFATAEEMGDLTNFYCLESHQYWNRYIREGLIGIMKDSVAYSFMNTSQFTQKWVNNISYLETAVLYASSYLNYCLDPHLLFLGHLPTCTTLSCNAPLTVLEGFHYKGAWMGCPHPLTLTRATDGCGPFKCTTESWTR